MDLIDKTTLFRLIFINVGLGICLLRLLSDDTPMQQKRRNFKMASQQFIPKRSKIKCENTTVALATRAQTSENRAPTAK